MSPRRSALTPELVAAVRGAFQLDWEGIHGAPHWARVRVNGLLLARETGARTDVVELFAFLHDSRRRDEGSDRGHGARAADAVAALGGTLLHLDRAGLDALVYACRHHSDGLTEADPTVQTCWDADRLDLARVGTRPSARFLCTAAARRPVVIADAVRRSLGERPGR